MILEKGVQKNGETYHGIWFSRACLSIGEQTAIKAIPGVIKNLLAQSFVNLVLVSIFGTSSLKDPIVCGTKLVVRPEGVIKGEGSFFTRIWIENGGCCTILHNQTNILGALDKNKHYKKGGIRRV